MHNYEKDVKIDTGVFDLDLTKTADAAQGPDDERRDEHHEHTPCSIHQRAGDAVGPYA